MVEGLGIEGGVDGRVGIVRALWLCYCVVMV